MTNEHTTEISVNENGEIMEQPFTPSQSPVIIQESPDFKIIKNVDGSYERIQKYHDVHFYKPETKEEKIKFFNATNEQENEHVTGLKELNNQSFVFKSFDITPFSTFDIETGKTETSVRILFVLDNGEFVATSSKSVYFFLKNLIISQQLVNASEFSVEVNVTHIKRENGYQPKLSLVDIDVVTQ